MNVFDPLADLPRRLQDSAVRDLAWSLLAPPLLGAAPCPQRHPLAGSAWTQDPQRLSDWLHGLDADPGALHAWLAARGSRRLGLYYERLWQFALQQAPGIEVLAANLPIREGGRTLGELDLVLRDAEGDHHLELAVKFYLGPSTAGGHDPQAWLGPGCEDRLGTKLAHLAAHQLPMSAHPSAQVALRALGVEALDAHAWLSGYLFYPQTGPALPPQGAYGAHLRGHWIYQRDWSPDPTAVWQPLPRGAWLAPARCRAPDYPSATALADWQQTLSPTTPAQLLVRLAPDSTGIWHEEERFFLVPDTWPQQLETGRR